MAKIDLDGLSIAIGVILFVMVIVLIIMVACLIKIIARFNKKPEEEEKPTKRTGGRRRKNLGKLASVRGISNVYTDLEPGVPVMADEGRQSSKHGSLGPNSLYDSIGHRGLGQTDVMEVPIETTTSSDRLYQPSATSRRYKKQSVGGSITPSGYGDSVSRQSDFSQMTQNESSEMSSRRSKNVRMADQLVTNVHEAEDGEEYSEDNVSSTVRNDTESFESDNSNNTTNSNQAFIHD